MFAAICHPARMEAIARSRWLALWLALLLTAVPGARPARAQAASADLSLSGAVDTPSQATGAQISYAYVLRNDGPDGASGVVVSAPLPTGTSYVAHSGGSYDPATGNWSVASLAPGQSVTLTITATITARYGTTVTSTAQVSVAALPDPDSTPGNGLSGEDDSASTSFTATNVRSAGVAPLLTCPAGSVVFDWDVQPWTSGSTSNSYTLAGLGSVGFVLTNPTPYVNDPSFGGKSPTLQKTLTGGVLPSEYSLIQMVDFADRNQTTRATITLGAVVPGAQFRLFDVDGAERVIVTGYRGATAVLPTLTHSVANYVIGNSVYGDSASVNESANGNVVATFSQPIDRIVIDFGNHGAAAVNPTYQGMALHDITLCKPGPALAVARSSTVLSDPANGSSFPKAVPGAVIELCLTVSNPGPGAVSQVVARDPLSAALTYVAGTLRSGPSCAGATTVEDDDALGSDESDALGGAVNAGTITLTAASLDEAAAVALRYQVTVN